MKTKKRSKNMETSVQKTSKAGELAKQEMLAEWGPAPISSKDIAIPMVWISQFMSDKVKDQEAKAGEYRDNVANKNLGGNGVSFEVIPFHTEKKWVEYDTSGKDKKYLQSIPVTPQNENLPYEDGNIQRDLVYYFYVLDATDVQSGLPFVVPLRRTSSKTAKNIMTQMYLQNSAAGKSPAAYTVMLDTKLEHGDKGDYFVATMKVGNETTAQDQAICLKWLKTIKAGQAQVKEDVPEQEPSTPATANTPREF